MRYKILISLISLGLSILPAVNFAGYNPLKGDGSSYIQSIHVANLLANANISDLGMTPTAIIVKYYNGGVYPCWSSVVNYHDDDTIHAGPTQGCVSKVDQVVMMPVVVVDKLKTYVGPISVKIDTTKYSSNILVYQDQAPVFDSQSGLVTTQGTIQYQVQTE